MGEIIIIALIAYFGYWLLTSDIRRKKKTLQYMDNFLRQQNFLVSKYIDIEVFANNKKNDPLTLTKFIVDNENKKFGIISCHIRNNKTEFKSYNYSDLINFNVFEDGEQLISGRGIATAVGAITFGVMGAIVASSGNKRIKNHCTELSIRIHIKELQNPLVNILILANCPKSSIFYKQAKATSDEIIATLSYIETENNTL